MTRFKGDDAGLVMVMGRAIRSARQFGHVRVGSEHLFLALTCEVDALADVLARHGITAVSLREIVNAAAPWGAGAAADRQLLGILGLDLESLLSAGRAPLDRPIGRTPAFPLRSNRARARSARIHPPMGLDAQAVYGSSLRLALARREDSHRTEHLALALVALDPGIDWMLAELGVDRNALLADLAGSYPPPRRGRLRRAERRLSGRAACRALVRRYQQLTGRAVVDNAAVLQLLSA